MKTDVIRPLGFADLDNLEMIIANMHLADLRSDLPGAISIDGMRRARGDATRNLAARALNIAVDRGLLVRRGALYWITPGGVDMLIMHQCQAANAPMSMDADFRWISIDEGEE